MHFHLARRHRRRLLFPPGLLALAGLLWLGCGAMRPWGERLKPTYVVELNMPVAPRGEQPTVRYEVPNPATVCRACSWHEAHFTGNRAADRDAQAEITRYVRDIKADTMHAGGIRIQLAPAARYESVVFMLNLMLENNIRKYWLDITRSPTTFYAFTDIYNPAPPIFSGFLCGTKDYATTLATKRVQRNTLGVNEWLQPLRQPNWRAALWLLAAIGATSSWRFFRFHFRN